MPQNATTAGLQTEEDVDPQIGDVHQQWQVERDEFIDGIQDIKSLVGTGKLTDALMQVQSELLPQPTSTSAPSKAAGYARKNPITSLQSPGASGIAQPLPDQLDSLATRTRILERMLGYFTALQETYASKLQRVHEEQRELAEQQTQEESLSAVPPLPAQIFEPSPRSPTCMDSDINKIAHESSQNRHADILKLQAEIMQQNEVIDESPEPDSCSSKVLIEKYQPERMEHAEAVVANVHRSDGVDPATADTILVNRISEAPEVVSLSEAFTEPEHSVVSQAVHAFEEQDDPDWVDVHEDGRALDEKADSTGERYDEAYDEHLLEHMEGQYPEESDVEKDESGLETLMMRSMKRGDGLAEAILQAGQEQIQEAADQVESDVDEEKCGEESEIKDDVAAEAKENSDEEETHDELGPCDSPATSTAKTLDELGAYDGPAASDAKAHDELGVCDSPAASTAKTHDEVGVCHSPAASTASQEPIRKTIVDQEGEERYPTASAASLQTLGNATADSDHQGRDEVPAQAPSKTKESAKVKSSAKKSSVAGGSKRSSRKTDSPQQVEQPSQPHEKGSRRPSKRRIDSRASSSRPPPAPSARQQLPGARPGSRQQHQQSQSQQSQSQQSQEQQAHQLQHMQQQQQVQLAAGIPSDLDSPFSQARPPPRPTRRAPWPRLAQNEVSCVQTLTLGTSVRSAICMGHEVWTVDWSGRVVIRGSADASQVLGEIPTNKFVWCMMHMEPGIMWMGQEAQGIALFDVTKKEFKGTLTGGHVGGVTCLAADNGHGDPSNADGPILRRRAWSASNDFTIRRWNVHTWPATDAPPEGVPTGGSKKVIELGDWKVSIARGRPMRGHRQGVRVLLQIGPTLWSGGDDGVIRIWRCVDDTCIEVIEDAHKGAVLKLVIVRSYVWSGGSDGLIKEWSIVGSPRQCLRQVSPEGSEKGIYGLVPLGHDVWVCGHHPMIQVLSQHSFGKTSEHKAHEPYISSLLAVDRVETRIVWSTSLGDKVLKVWRHTIRGFQPSIDELRAANQLFQADEALQAGNANAYIDRASKLEEDLVHSSQEYQEHLEKLSLDLVEAVQKSEDLDQQRKGLEDELLRFRSLFEKAGVADLLQSPDDLHPFLERALQLGKMFNDPALASLLEKPDELQQFLQSMHTIKDLLESLGMRDVLDDPLRLQRFLEAAYEVKNVCAQSGLSDVFEDSSLLQRFLEAAFQVNSLCESHGMKSVLEDPTRLKSFLESSNLVKGLCEKQGLGNIYDDPSALRLFLMASDHLKKLCERHGLQNVFEDPSELGSMLSEFSNLKHIFEQNGFLDLLRNPNKLSAFFKDRALLEAELEDAREQLGRLQLAEERLCDLAVELADANQKVAEFNALGGLESLRCLQEDAEEARLLRDARSKFQKELGAMQNALEQKEQERLDALEKLRAMALKYKELDIFKLDIIARELKSIDGEFGGVGKATRELQNDANKLKHYDEQQKFGSHGARMYDQCVQLRAHIRDVINKCLSETQKLHIGISVDDHMGAGELQDGGVMGGYFLEEVEVPEHGNSKAARVRQNDEMSRDRRLSKDVRPLSLPRISSTSALPPRAPPAMHDSARGFPSSPVTGAAAARGSPTRMSSLSPGRWSTP